MTYPPESPHQAAIAQPKPVAKPPQQAPASVALVEVAGTIMQANSIVAIGPVEEIGCHTPGFFCQAFWVSATHGPYQWRGRRYQGDSDHPPVIFPANDVARNLAEQARQDLINAVWPNHTFPQREP